VSATSTWRIARASKPLFRPGKFPQHAASHALVAVAPPV